MDFCLKEATSAEYLPDELLGSYYSGRKSFENFTMKQDTEDGMEPMNRSLGAINGKECMMLLSNMSNHATNVNDDPEFAKRSLYIPRGV